MLPNFLISPSPANLRFSFGLLATLVGAGSGSIAAAPRLGARSGAPLASKSWTSPPTRCRATGSGSASSSNRTWCPANGDPSCTDRGSRLLGGAASSFSSASPWPRAGSLPATSSAAGSASAAASSAAGGSARPGGAASSGSPSALARCCAPRIRFSRRLAALRLALRDGDPDLATGWGGARSAGCFPEGPGMARGSRGTGSCSASGGGKPPPPAASSTSTQSPALRRAMLSAAGSVNPSRESRTRLRSAPPASGYFRATSSSSSPTVSNPGATRCLPGIVSPPASPRRLQGGGGGARVEKFEHAGPDLREEAAQAVQSRPASPLRSRADLLLLLPTDPRPGPPLPPSSFDRARQTASFRVASGPAAPPPGSAEAPVPGGGCRGPGGRGGAGGAGGRTSTAPGRRRRPRARGSRARTAASTGSSSPGPPRRDFDWSVSGG